MSDVLKLTISLSRDLVEFADVLSKERNTSRSGAIVLQDLADERERLAMIEGYKAMAEQHRGFAAVTLPLANGISPEWK